MQPKNSKTRRVAAFALMTPVALTIPRLIAQTPAPPAGQEVVSILKQKCFQCHSGKLQMSKLDLTSRESILQGGEKGPAIVPGNADASRLYRRVAGLEQPAMPMAPLPPLGHTAFMVSQSFSKSANRRGSLLRTASPSGVAALGLRFSPIGGTFTSFPALTSADIQP